jgi:hypothetical protein
MERAAFLLPEDVPPLECLLNPETVVIRREAGIRRRRLAGGQLTGAGLSDDPLLYTGGGRTEIVLELLFDVNVSGMSEESRDGDVRDLTGRFWNLAENWTGEDRYGEPPVVRFVWGKVWNVPVVVAEVAERLEHFTSEGMPQRSWMKMKLLRVREPADTGQVQPVAQARVEEAIAAAQGAATAEEIIEGIAAQTAGANESHEAVAGERLADIAARYYGDPSYWRLLATVNNIDDPMNVPPGTTLIIPPAPDLVWGVVQTVDQIGEGLRTSFTSLLKLNPFANVRLSL